MWLIFSIDLFILSVHLFLCLSGPSTQLALGDFFLLRMTLFPSEMLCVTNIGSVSLVPDSLNIAKDRSKYGRACPSEYENKLCILCSQCLSQVEYIKKYWMEIIFPDSDQLSSKALFCFAFGLEVYLCGWKYTLKKNYKNRPSVLSLCNAGTVKTGMIPWS